MSENSRPLDLLGDPIEDPKDRRGRPGFDVTEEKRCKVKLLAAVGHTNDFIAQAIGCCEKTLRNYFILELEEGAALTKGDVLFKLYERGVVEGNVSALGKLAVMLVGSDATLPDQGKPVQPANTKQSKLGKKEQAQLEAEKAHEDSEWADLLH